MGQNLMRVLPVKSGPTECLLRMKMMLRSVAYPSLSPSVKFLAQQHWVRPCFVHYGTFLAPSGDNFFTPVAPHGWGAVLAGSGSTWAQTAGSLGGVL